MYPSPDWDRLICSVTWYLQPVLRLTYALSIAHTISAQCCWVHLLWLRRRPPRLRPVHEPVRVRPWLLRAPLPRDRRAAAMPTLRRAPSRQRVVQRRVLCGVR